MTSKWKQAQAYELDWHRKQQFNTYNEQTKQYIYASKMGLDKYKTDYFGQIGWNFGDKTIIDIGGGEQSILLKSKAKRRTVIDPLHYADWIKMRYIKAGINFAQCKAEELDDLPEYVEYDIALIYNVLQHTEDPAKIIKNVRKISKEIHIFEWIEKKLSPGHIQYLTENKLNNWLKGEGKVEFINQYPCVGQAYMGIFKGNLYEKI